MVAGKGNVTVDGAANATATEGPVTARDIAIEGIEIRDAVEGIRRAQWMRVITLIVRMNTSISRSPITTSSSVVWHHK